MKKQLAAFAIPACLAIWSILAINGLVANRMKPWDIIPVVFAYACILITSMAIWMSILDR